VSKASSRIPGFYRLPVDERRKLLRLAADLSEQDMRTLDGGGIDTAVADRVVENAVGVYALPLGVGLNFVINGRDVLAPMAVEEPSVIAAASNAARMVREGGGFVADADDPVMTAQIEIVGVDDPEAARARLEEARAELLALAHATLPRLADRGGGCCGCTPTCRSRTCARWTRAASTPASRIAWSRTRSASTRCRSGSD